MATASSSSATPAVLREQGFLKKYFQCLSKFDYDKAKEIMDKERETTKVQATLLWSSLLSQLNTLATSEKTFYSLLFLCHNLGSRLLGRKDTLRTTYSCLLSELKKIEKAYCAVAPSSVGDGSLEQLTCNLCGQLQHFITARIKTIGFYEQMVMLGQSRNVSCDDLLGVITEISSVCGLALQHPILESLTSSFRIECDSITYLLQAQIHIQTCEYLPALLSLYNAQSKLTEWASLVTVKDAKKLGFGGAQKTWSPALCDWLVKYKNVLVSKFSLYFYEALSKQGPPQEVRTLVSKTSIDFCSKISAFQKRSDAVNVSLIFNANESKNKQFPGLGYHLSQRSSETDSGHDGYYAIFSCPSELSDYHWLRVYHMLMQKSSELEAWLDKPVYRCDEGHHMAVTYFMMRTDALVTLLVVYEAKKAERDSNVLGFFLTIAAELRCTRLFAALRPGHKS